MTETMVKAPNGKELTINAFQGHVKGSIERLDKTVTDLRSRLGPILGPELPVDPETTGEAMSESPIAEFLRDSSSSILKICSVLDDIVARIQC